jgi:hypothetical protein
MPSRKDDDRTNLLQGTLDLLILRTLVLGAQHGQGIARLIQQQSEDVFLVDHGTVYLALQRLEERAWLMPNGASLKTMTRPLLKPVIGIRVGQSLNRCLVQGRSWPPAY